MGFIEGTRYHRINVGLGLRILSKVFGLHIMTLSNVNNTTAPVSPQQNARAMELSVQSTTVSAYRPWSSTGSKNFGNELYAVVCLKASAFSSLQHSLRESTRAGCDITPWSGGNSSVRGGATPLETRSQAMDVFGKGVWLVTPGFRKGTVSWPKSAPARLCHRSEAVLSRANVSRVYGCARSGWLVKLSARCYWISTLRH